MLKLVHVSAVAFASALLLSGAAFASDTPASESPPPPAQGDAQPPAQPASPATPQTAAEKDPLDEIVCRKEEATVGSRLGSRKVCKSRRQWRDERRDATSADIPDGSILPGPGVPIK